MSSPFPPSEAALRRSAFLKALRSHAPALVVLGLLSLAGAGIALSARGREARIQVPLGLVFATIPGLVLWKATLPSLRSARRRGLLPLEGIPASAEVLSAVLRRPRDEAPVFEVHCRFEHRGELRTATTDFPEWEAAPPVTEGQTLPILVSPGHPECIAIRSGELPPWAPRPSGSGASSSAAREDRTDGGESPGGSPPWHIGLFALLPAVCLGTGTVLALRGFTQWEPLTGVSGLVLLGTGLSLGRRLVTLLRREVQARKTLAKGLSGTATVEAVALRTEMPRECDEASAGNPDQGASPGR